MTEPAAAVIRAAMLRARRLPTGNLSAWTTTVAGRTILLRYNDPALGELQAARLAHAEPGATGPADLMFDLFESDPLGWPPATDWPFWDDDRERLNRHLADAQLGVLVPPERIEPDFPCMAFDPAERHGVILTRRSADLPGWVSGAPFAHLLHLALASEGARLLHAGTLAAGDSGALIVGVSGAGKSATTLSGVLAGLATVGDDYVAVEGTTAWPVYANVKQTPAGLARFPELERRVGHLPRNWNGKVEFDHRFVAPDGLAPNIGLRAILLPEISGDVCTVAEPVPPTVVFSAMAHALMPQLPGALLAGFNFLTRLSRRLPGYRLRLSPDPEEVGARVAALLAGR